MLELERLNAFYGKNHVLRDVSLTVKAGEVVALIGGNAAGKTTTLRSAIGLKDLRSGSVRLDGVEVGQAAARERVHRGIVLVPEGRQVFVRFSVAENLMMGGYHRSDRDRMQPDIERMYAMFPRLGERRQQRAGSLSGGEQQMLALARGLMAKPRCLLLDEPTLGLAPIIVDEIAAAVQRLAKEGMAVLLAEQNAAMALGCCHRGYVLESGRISLEGPGEELQRSETVAKLYLGP